MIFFSNLKHKHISVFQKKGAPHRILQSNEWTATQDHTENKWIEVQQLGIAVSLQCSEIQRNQTRKQVQVRRWQERQGLHWFSTTARVASETLTVSFKSGLLRLLMTSPIKPLCTVSITSNPLLYQTHGMCLTGSVNPTGA